MDRQSPISDESRRPAQRRRRWWWIGGVAVLIVMLGVGRAMLPSVIQRYVNRTIDRSEGYSGRIGDIDVHLYRGAYSIRNVEVVQTAGTVPVPLFKAERVDLAVEWGPLLRGKVVGRIVMHAPELNFVDVAEDDTGAEDQTGAGGPWLEIIADLFPFTINSVVVHDGSIHFRSFQGDHPLDVYLSSLEATVENLTNVRDEVTPLVTTVDAHALAMDQAEFEYQMELDPFSYRPTFRMAVRLLGLDVTRLNDLTRTYGAFDFEHGWFDLVMEVESTEGAIEGYVKPLFRDLKVLSLEHDLREDNALEVFWEALVGGAEFLLRNHPRGQFGTRIPFTGDITDPDVELLATIGNILRNAFVRAYLPRLQGSEQPPRGGLEFEPPTIVEPSL